MDLKWIIKTALGMNNEHPRHQHLYYIKRTGYASLSYNGRSALFTNQLPDLRADTVKQVSVPIVALKDLKPSSVNCTEAEWSNTTHIIPTGAPDHKFLLKLPDWMACIKPRKRKMLMPVSIQKRTTNPDFKKASRLCEEKYELIFGKAETDLIAYFDLELALPFAGLEVAAHVYGQNQVVLCPPEEAAQSYMAMTWFFLIMQITRLEQFDPDPIVTECE